MVPPPSKKVSMKVLVVKSIALMFSSTRLVRTAAFHLPLHRSMPSVGRRGSSTRLSSAIGSTEKATGVVLNPSVTAVKISKTVEVFSLVKQMEAQGETVTSLCVGEPDFPPPPAVLKATVDAVNRGQTTYTAVTGTAALRNAIAADLKARKGVTYDANTEIVVANGAKQAVYQGVLATLTTGDKAIIPAPYWPSYPEMVRLAGGTPVTMQTKAKDGYLIDPQELRRVLEQEGSSVRLLFLCNPSNPTGGVHDEAALKEIANVLADFPQVAILADEIYERLVYGDHVKHTSFAAIDGMWERTLTINGMSKAYAMTGYRLGYLAAPANIAKACTTIQSQLTSCASSISQAAGVAALTEVTEEELQENNNVMQAKRDYVIERLRGMPKVTIDIVPDGAFYVMPNVESYYNGDDAELCLDLLQSQKLALVPGSSFGAPGTVRISYATSMEELELAMTKLETFLQQCEA